MAKLGYKELRDNLLLVLAYYQNFELAKPFKTDESDNPKQGHLDMIEKLESEILYVDQRKYLNAVKKFARLSEILKNLNKDFQPDGIFFGGSRLKAFLNIITQVELNGDFDYEELEDSTFPLTFFHSDNQSKNTFHTDYMFAAVLRNLKQVAPKSDLIAKVERANNPMAGDIKLANMRQMFQNFVNDQTSEEEVTAIHKVIHAESSLNHASASAQANDAEVPEHQSSPCVIS